MRVLCLYILILLVVTGCHCETIEYNWTYHNLTGLTGIPSSVEYNGGLDAQFRVEKEVVIAEFPRALPHSFVVHSTEGDYYFKRVADRKIFADQELSIVYKEGVKLEGSALYYLQPLEGSKWPRYRFILKRIVNREQNSPAEAGQ